MLIEKDYDIIDDDSDFKYLVKMSMDAVSDENVEKLLKELVEKQDIIDRIKATTIQQMWLSELEILENEYQEYQSEREQAQRGDVKKSKKKPVMKVVGGGGKKVVKKTTKVNLLIEE